MNVRHTKDGVELVEEKLVDLCEDDLEGLAGAADLEGYLSA